MAALPTRLLITVLIRFLGGLVFLGALLFIPAGTLSYWQAWLYLAVLFLPMSGVFLYLARNDPGLVARRMRIREKEAEQKRIIMFSTAIFLLCMLIPGLDFRYGWSQVPFWLVILANTGVFSGYLTFFITLKENSYASRIIDVEAGQQVISTGPYAYIRHPMYAGMLLLFLCTPLALGSFIALVLFPPVLFSIVLRIRNEEEVLTRDLPGYAAYRNKTRHRLVPGIW